MRKRWLGFGKKGFRVLGSGLVQVLECIPTKLSILSDSGSIDSVGLEDKLWERTEEKAKKGDRKGNRTGGGRDPGARFQGVDKGFWFEVGVCVREFALNSDDLPDIKLWSRAVAPMSSRGELVLA